MRRFVPLVLGCVAVLAALTVALLAVRPEEKKAGTKPNPRPQPEPAPRPNVVLVSLDTLRPDHLGCYGYERDTSPRIDALAAESSLFTRASCQAPWTLPSHMSLFTSMMPSRNRVEDINQRLPEGPVTLAQALRQAGYQTAGLVNDAQMKAHWGFDRGFDTWREFAVNTPAGNCENITDQALEWLKDSPSKPFFLFLHYYDPHDPYDPPPRFRRKFDAELFGQAAHKIVWQHRYPAKDIDNPRLMEEIKAAYDGEIAWLDEQIGRLIRALPPNTIVVLFSDHGEAFEEHGWMTHGASLYEEEVRVLLLFQVPGEYGDAGRIDRRVRLLDVAPTLASLCGVNPGPDWQGRDLTPVLRGEKLDPAPVYAETKRLIEGRILKMVQRGEWKLIHSLFDANTELYRLPDEHTNRATEQPRRTERMLKTVREWMELEDYWMLRNGPGTRVEGTLRVPEENRFSVFIPVGFERPADRLRPAPDGSTLHFSVRGGKGPKALYFELNPRNTRFVVDLKMAGERQPDRVITPDGTPAGKLPLTLGPDAPALDPFIEERPGIPPNTVRFTHRRGDEEVLGASGVELDRRTRRELRSLGYMQ